jgi:hypothetical protein
MIGKETSTIVNRPSNIKRGKIAKNTLGSNRGQKEKQLPSGSD